MNREKTRIQPLPELYEDLFLKYASYAVCERAIPKIGDGLKPVQRRLLYAMYLIEDGRYHKVSNIVGRTMQYHPHGNASIADALVHLAQKGLLIDPQGNWGDFRTGDNAAAERYIEARLTPFAKEVLYSAHALTAWKMAYDERKEEPRVLPVKFPLLLVQGAEGIAVGLSTKILPHNFCEVIEAAISLLEGKPFELYPDFPAGGIADCTHYQKGGKGSRVLVRATISIEDPQTLLISDLPYGVTTTHLIESILKANDKGEVRIRQVIDNTAREVAIKILLLPGSQPDHVIQTLYAFTDCEISLAPKLCVIQEEHPRFLDVDELLIHSVATTQEILRQELLLQKKELEEKICFLRLATLFIQEKVYREMEACHAWEEVLPLLRQRLLPYEPQLGRPLQDSDLERLTQLKIRKISAYDIQEALEREHVLAATLLSVEKKLADMVGYTIAYYQRLLREYGEQRPRRTRLQKFDKASARQLLTQDLTLRADYTKGFVGYQLEEAAALAPCSLADEVILFFEDGRCQVISLPEKLFAGNGLLHAAIFYRHESRRVYHMIYLDGQAALIRVKRFTITSVTRQRIYQLIPDHPDSRVLYLSDNPNGEAETVEILLSPKAKARQHRFLFDFSTVRIKGREALGVQLTRHTIRRITKMTQGGSTLAPYQLWYEAALGYLNDEGKGALLGEFTAADQIGVLYADGRYERVPCRSRAQYDPDQVRLLLRHSDTTVVTLVYTAGKGKKQRFFWKECSLQLGKKDEKRLLEEDAILQLAALRPAPPLRVLRWHQAASDAEPCLLVSRPARKKAITTPQPLPPDTLSVSWEEAGEEAQTAPQPLDSL